MAIFFAAMKYVNHAICFFTKLIGLSSWSEYWFNLFFAILTSSVLRLLNFRSFNIGSLCLSGRFIQYCNGISIRTELFVIFEIIAGLVARARVTLMSAPYWEFNLRVEFVFIIIDLGSWSGHLSVMGNGSDILIISCKK